MAKNKTIEIDVEVKPDLRGMAKMRKELKEVTDDLVEALSMEDVDTKKVEELNLKAAALKDTMADVNEQVNIFATGSKYEAVSNSIGGIGKSLKNLDFAKASQRANTFAMAAKRITFKDAIGSVKDLGKTFFQVGKALLTNPLFLIGAIIALVAVKVYELLDSLGFIEDMLNVLMLPLNLLMDGLKALMNLFTGGAVDAKEAAEAKAKAYEDAANRIETANKTVIQSLDNEIRMARLNGEDTVELERNKLITIQETARARAKADKAAFEAALLNGKLTKEEITEIKNKATESRKALEQTYNDIVYFDAKTAKEREDASEKEREKENKSNEDAVKEADRIRKDALAAQKKYNDDRIKATREIENLTIQAIEDETEREIMLNDTKYKRLIEDTLRNENLKASERDRLVKLLEEESAKKLTDINNRIELERSEKASEALKIYNDMLLGLNKNLFIIEKENIEKQNEERLTLLKKQLDDKLITQEQFNDIEIALEEDKQRKLKELSSIDDIGESNIDKLIRESEEAIEIERMKLEAGLINQEEFNQRQIALHQEMTDAIDVINQAAADKEKKLQEDILKAKLNSIKQVMDIQMQSMNAVFTLMEANLDREITAAEGNEKAQEALRKKGFEQNKKMQIANAVMGAAQGVIAGLGAPFPMNIALPIIAGVTGAAAIAKIASTSYTGGSTGGGLTPAKPDMGGNVGGSMTRSLPNVNFTGNNNQNNNVNASPEPMIINVNATVSETEVTNVQNRNENRKRNAEL
jgi:hypothetical protein